MNAARLHPALTEIQRAFDARGGKSYGESVSQTEHALQCATLAEAQGADLALVLAAWLHDIGHLQHRDTPHEMAEGTDDLHELVGAKFLARWFGPEVSEPVRLHVAAKRYLCAREPGYWDGLSAASKRSLQFQGGVMSTEQAADFERTPFSDEALRLRRWDDLGKQPNMDTPPLAHFMALAARWIRPTVG